MQVWLMNQNGDDKDRCGHRRFRSSVTRPVARRSQGGFSFVENLIVILLASTVIAAIAGGMLTLMKVNRATSEVEQIQLALGNFTEQLVASTYIPCGQPAGVQPSAAAYNALPELWVPTRPDMTASVTGVGFWDDAQGAFVATCPSTGDQGTQRLDVEVTLGQRRGTAQIVTIYHPEVTP